MNYNIIAYSIYIPTSIAYAGQFIMIRDGGVVTAYDLKTGDEVYQKRAASTGTSTPVRLAATYTCAMWKAAFR